MALSRISGTTGIVDGSITSAKLADFSAAVDLNGVELILDADADTSISADTDDQIDIKIANADHLKILSSSGDTVFKPMVDAKDIIFQQFDGNKVFEINDGNFVSVGGNATAAGQIRIYEDTDNGSHYSGFTVGNLTASVAYQLPDADGSSGQALITDGSGVLSFTTLSANTPSSADGQALGSASLEWSDLFLADGGTIQFGNDQEVTLTHVHDTGLLLSATDQLQFGDSGTYIHQSADGVLDLVSDTEIEINATTIDINGNVEISGTTAQTGVLTANAGVVIDNFTIDGTEIDLSSGDLTVDVEGDIILDANGGDIFIKDDGTQIGAISNAGSNNFQIASSISDGDLLLKGNDGGSEITALTLDMSDAGTATFNHDIVLADDNIAKFGDSGELHIYHHNNGTSYIQETGGGNLELLASNFKVLNAAGTENKIAATTDGAVDLYHNNVKKFETTSTGVSITGGFSATVGSTITTADNTDTLTLTSTDTDANGGPNLRLLRSATGAAADTLGVIDFAGKDDGGNLTDYARIEVVIDDASDGNEDASLIFRLLNGGALNQTFKMTGPETVINDASIDHDFRVESNGNAHALFVDGGNDRVGILNSSPSKVLDVTGDAKVSTDLTVGDDLFMLSDAAVIHFGADSEITLTHVHDAGLILGGTTPTLTVGDGGAEDAKIIFDGNEQNFYIGLDDSTNKLTIGLGNALGTYPGFTMDENTAVVFPDNQVTIQTTGTGDHLTLVSTDAGTGVGPNIVYYRNSSSPAANDYIGEVTFRGRNNASQDVDYARINTRIKDVADGGENANVIFNVIRSGSEVEVLRYGEGITIFNEGSADLDFRVESNGNANALFIDGGNNRVGIGTGSPDYTLHVRSMGSPSNDTIIDIEANATDGNAGIQFTNSGGTLRGRILYDTDDNTLATTVNTSEVQRYLSGGQFLINRTSSNQNDHDNGKYERLGVTETGDQRNALYLSNTGSSFGSYSQRNDVTRAAHSGYGFFIGSSGNEGDNEIRMMGDGSINSDGSNNLGSGADYAEYFEWKDGNSSDEDRRGYSVVLDGNQIVKATDSDDASKIIGVISGNPAVVGDSAWNKWNQKHLKDDFNTYIWEDYTQTEWTDADGNFISHQTDLIPDGVTAPDDAVVVSKENDGTTNLQRRKVNPSWDSTATYVPRSDRKEWDTVGLMGKLRLKKGQPTGTNWIKMRDISDTVEEWLIR